jgi:nitrite reductase/ring-hydroxylating ferredoxin subunit
MKNAFCLLLLIVGLAGCAKDDQSYIPTVSVNLQLPLTDPRLAALGSQGGAVTLNGYGVAGIVIYCIAPNNYVAYDRCSSYQPEKKCAVTLDSPALTVTDPCSGSKFLLSDGSPVKAPATRSLKSYNVYVNNFNIFVSN